MNRLLLAIVTLISVGGTFVSCNKDTSEEEILNSQLATADSLLKRGGVIKYTVKIVSTANSSILKSKMSIENAEVTVYQNDKVYTAATDANGFAVFSNMRIGTAAVNVKLKDHAEVDYIADLTPAENLINISQSQMVNTVRYASTLVPMFPIAAPGAATITGRVTAELDLTNQTPEPAPNVTVTAKVDVDDPDFVSRYITPTQGTTNSNAGRIIKFAFQDAIVSAQTDANGAYSLLIPAALNGLPIKLSISDYQTSQKIYLESDPASGNFAPGEYTVPVLFSNNLDASIIPLVKPVYVVVDEPTAPIGIIHKPASFTFELDANGGISKVNVVNKGLFSAKPSIVVVDNGNSTSAILDPVYNTSTREIDGVNIISPGSGYSTVAYNVILLQSKRTAKLSATIDDSGNIYAITILDKGIGYITKPNVRFLSPFSKAVEPQVSIVMNYWNGGEITSLKLLRSGANYKSTTNYPSDLLTLKAPSYSKTLTVATGASYISNFDLNTGYRNK